MAISISNNQTFQNIQELNNFDREFIEMVNNRITVYGQIPYTVPERLIIDIIKSSGKFFYQYYGDAWYKTFYLIKKDDIKRFIGPTNEQAIAIQVHPRIRIIKKVWDSKGESYNYGNSINNTFNSLEISGTQSEASAGNSPGLTYNVGNASNYWGIDNWLYNIGKAVEMAETNVIDSIFKTSIGFSFTDTSGILILRNIPQNNIILECYADIPLYKLYNNTFFERHVIGCVKRELKRVLSGHTFELVGGTTINGDEICNNLEDIELVESAIKAASGIGDIILKR